MKYFKEHSGDTRVWDATVTALVEASREAEELIEFLRGKLDETRERIETLEDQITDLNDAMDDLRNQLAEDE